MCANCSMLSFVLIYNLLTSFITFSSAVTVSPTLCVSEISDEISLTHKTRHSDGKSLTHETRHSDGISLTHKTRPTLCY